MNVVADGFEDDDVDGRGIDVDASDEDLLIVRSVCSLFLSLCVSRMTKAFSAKMATGTTPNTSSSVTQDQTDHTDIGLSATPGRGEQSSTSAL